MTGAYEGQHLRRPALLYGATDRFAMRRSLPSKRSSPEGGHGQRIYRFPGTWTVYTDLTTGLPSTGDQVSGCW